MRHIEKTWIQRRMPALLSWSATCAVVAAVVLSNCGLAQTAIMGANAAGTVRVNNLANLEALLNIIANGIEIMGLANGIPAFCLGFAMMTLPDRRKWSALCIALGIIVAVVGIAAPGVINWLVASARDANLFD